MPVAEASERGKWQNAPFPQLGRGGRSVSAEQCRSTEDVSRPEYPQPFQSACHTDQQRESKAWDLLARLAFGSATCLDEEE
ncbi:hypothetical protein Q5P01_011185 [Channa striata]|uniref:Uncharacterized protein n=1 Tax=Channa striata TaxID=64152 RepID=A0AA88SNX0_CHASR|nr:hypothetical protein Q5P01_011185 [Channa striata]